MTTLLVPQRRQRERRAGWHFPTNAVYVGRGRSDYGKYGNPYRATDFSAIPDATGPADGHHGDVRQIRAAVKFDIDLRTGTIRNYPTIAMIRRELAGKDIVCWCALTDYCHGDTLLDVANTVGPVSPVLAMRTAHHAVLGAAFHNIPRPTATEPAAVADLVHAGYLTYSGLITEIGREAWIREAPWSQYAAPRLFHAGPRST